MRYEYCASMTLLRLKAARGGQRARFSPRRSADGQRRNTDARRKARSGARSDAEQGVGGENSRCSIGRDVAAMKAVDASSLLGDGCFVERGDWAPRRRRRSGFERIVTETRGGVFVFSAKIVLAKILEMITIIESWNFSRRGIQGKGKMETNDGLFRRAVRR
jgi:hypothetical protein